MAVIVSPITGKTISDIDGISGVMGLLYEDIEKIIEGAQISLRYPEFERTVSEWGGMIVEGRIPAADGTTVNKNTTAICGPYYFSVKTEYYDQWVEAVYPSEIRRIELTKILRGEAEYSDFLRKIVERNLNGYRRDVNKSVDQMFADEQTSGDPAALVGYDSSKTTISAALAGGVGFLNGTTGTDRIEVLEGADGAPSFADVYSAILSEVLHMGVENSAYTEGSDEWGQNMDDLTIYLPIDFMANSDIRYLQKLMNDKGLVKLPQIKTHNGEPISFDSGKTAQVVYILDRHVINHVNRYMSYDDDNVFCRRSEQLALHVEHMLKYSPLYKAWAFAFEMPTDDGGAVLINA